MTRAKNNMVIFKKPQKSVFDLVDLKVTEVGEIVKSENKTKNYEKVEKVLYSPLNLGKQDKPITKVDLEKDYTLHAKYFGIATHYCLEMMDSFDEDSLSYSLNLVKNRYSSYLNNEDFKAIKKRVLNLINNKEFQLLIENAQFNKEQSLIYKNELKIIDLLVKKIISILFLIIKLQKKSCKNIFIK